MSDEHVWTVGDICTCGYNTEGCVLYRVISVNDHDPNNPVLKIKPIHGIFTDLSGRKVRTIGGGWCQPLNLIEMGTEYMKLGQLIAEEAERRAGDKIEP